MITVGDIKNFFKNYWSYLLLITPWASVLSIGVYYFTTNNQLAIVNHGKALAEKERAKKLEKTLDPVVDNVYWSIASLVVYYSVYLGLRYLGYKDQAVWVIVLSIFLSKIGLAAFSSYYYQKNDFDQNLEKSFHPGYFIHQDIYQIILSLVGYLGLVALIYFDRQKEPGQQPEIEPQPNNNDNTQETLDFFEKGIKTAKNFMLSDARLKPEIDSWENEDFFNIDLFVNSIKSRIKNKKISRAGVQSLISGAHFIAIKQTPESGSPFGEHTFKYKFCEREDCQTPIFDCLFSFLGFIKVDDEIKEEMIDTFLIEVSKNPSDEKIFSLKALINELVYFVSCLKSFYKYIFDAEYEYKKINFKNAEDTQNFHLNFLSEVAKKSGAELFFNRDNPNAPNDVCKKIERYHIFFANEQIKNMVANNIQKDGLDDLLKRLITQYAANQQF